MSATVRVIYKAAKGAPFASKDAPLIGRRIEGLERTSGGGVTPEMVVNDAKEKASPLHKYFAWNDRKAAHAWRLQQARNIINHLIVIVRKDDREMDVKGFHSVRMTVPGEEEQERSYASFATVDSEPDLRKQVVLQAIKEMEYWQARYGQLEDLWEWNRVIEKGKRKVKEKVAGAAQKN